MGRGGRSAPRLETPAKEDSTNVRNPRGIRLSGPSTVGGRCLGCPMTAIAHHQHRARAPLSLTHDNSLAQVAEVPVWSMDATETTATIDQLTAMAAQVAELQARVLHHADRIDLAGNSGATSTANWYAHTTRTTRPAAHRAIRLAQGLETHDLIRVALADGRLHAEQAEAILRDLAELPEDLDPDLKTQAETHLIEQAASFDAKGLKHLGRCILQVIDPDAADAHEAKLLEKEDATTGRRPAGDVGRRPRQGPREVHRSRPRRRHAQEGAPRHRGTEAPGQQRTTR